MDGVGVAQSQRVLPKKGSVLAHIGSTGVHGDVGRRDTQPRPLHSKPAHQLLPQPSDLHALPPPVLLLPPSATGAAAGAAADAAAAALPSCLPTAAMSRRDLE